jgi:hypothetical protein
MQIMHHSTDATQMREAERLAERKGNEEKENSHPKEIEAGQGSSRAAVARARCFQRRARRRLLGSGEERNCGGREKRGERSERLLAVDREREVNVGSGEPTT